nr:hypothetical protein CFP56_07928 [Quercus suber]
MTWKLREGTLIEVWFGEFAWRYRVCPSDEWVSSAGGVDGSTFLISHSRGFGELADFRIDEVGEAGDGTGTVQGQARGGKASLLQLGLAILRHFRHDLAPGASAAQRLERGGHALQPDVLLVGVVGAPDLAALEQLEQLVPDDLLHLGLVGGVGAPVQAHDRDVLQQHLVRRDLLDGPAGEADHQQPAVPRDALGALVDQAHGVVDDVDAALPRRQRLDRLRPARVVVVHHVVRPELPRDRQLVRRPGRRHDRRAERLGDLHRRQPHPARRRVHQHPVARLDLRPRHQPRVGRRHRDEQPRRLEAAPALRHRLQLRLDGADLRRVPALRRAEHLVADPELGAALARDRGHDARELRAGDPRQLGLVLVFAPDLQQIEEVGGRGMDVDAVLVRVGLGVRQVLDFQVLRAGDVLGDGNAAHVGTVRVKATEDGRGVQ